MSFSEMFRLESTYCHSLLSAIYLYNSSILVCVCVFFGNGTVFEWMHFYKLFELMFVGSVCTHYPIMIKIHCVYPFLKSSRLAMWRHTDGGPSHDCWLTSYHLTSDPPWVSCHQLFHHCSRCRQEWRLVLSDWGVLLLDIIMNIAVVI